MLRYNLVKALIFEWVNKHFNLTKTIRFRHSDTECAVYFAMYSENTYMICH